MKGWLLSDLLKNVKLEAFIRITNAAMGSVNATKILEAYDITPKMDLVLFWTKLNFLMGDVMFSQPAHKLTRALASSTNPHKMKVYRYHQSIRGPFLGDHFQIPGPHSIEQLFLWGTMRDSYSSQKLRDISDEYGKRWIAFGNGKAPWQEFGAEQNIMVIDGRKGFELRTRSEDEAESKWAEEGERRYKGWEVFEEVMVDLVEERGIEGAARARMEWTTDGGINRLAGLKGPFGGVLS